MSAFDAKPKKGHRGTPRDSRADSGNSFNREDTRNSNQRHVDDDNRGNRWDTPRASADVKAKRPRITRSAPTDRDWNKNREKDGNTERRSFNPNFTKDNQHRDNNNDNRDRGYRPRPNDRKDSAGGNRNWNKDGDNRSRNFSSDRNRNDGGKNFKRSNNPRNSKPQYDKENYPRYDAPKATGAVRLNRYIANSGICSRREADDYIQAGLVTVNGAVVTELGSKVMPGDEVRFNDSIIRGEKKVYIVMNKPKGFVTSLDDPHAEKTVMDLVKDACNERVYPVGRLDKNSVGVLLITNDGELTRDLTHPSRMKKKIYQVMLDKPLTKAYMEQIALGIELEDGMIYADEISYVNDNKREIGIEIHSGRNRIVRRIFEALGYSVQKLDRVYFAGLTKKGLKRGGWRFLTPREVTMLKSGNYE